MTASALVALGAVPGVDGADMLRQREAGAAWAASGVLPPAPSPVGPAVVDPAPGAHVAQLARRPANYPLPAVALAEGWLAEPMSPPSPARPRAAPPQPLLAAEAVVPVPASPMGQPAGGAPAPPVALAPVAGGPAPAPLAAGAPAPGPVAAGAPALGPAAAALLPALAPAVDAPADVVERDPAAARALAPPVVLEEVGPVVLSTEVDVVIGHDVVPGELHFVEPSPHVRLSLAQFVEAQRVDRYCVIARALLDKRDLPADADPKLAKCVAKVLPWLCVRKDDLLVFVWEPLPGASPIPDFVERVVVPAALLPRVLCSVHDDAGHPGSKGTADLFARRYYYYGVSALLRAYVSGCRWCTEHKFSRKPTLGLMGDFNGLQHRPMSCYSLDVMFGFPCSHSGNTCLLVGLDMASNHVVAVPMQSASADELAHAFMTYIVGPLGRPALLLTDNGGNFVSNTFRQLLGDLGIRQLTSAAHHAQGNARNERSHALLRSIIMSVCCRDGKDWDVYVGYAMLTYNGTVNATTHLSAFYAMFGREPVDTTLPDEEAEATINWISADDAARLQSIWRANMSVGHDLRVKASDKSRIRFNAKHRPHGLAVGDLVVLRNERDRTAVDQDREYRFRRINVGPFKVIDLPGDGLHDVIVQDPAGAMPPRRMHVSQVFKPKFVSGADGQVSLVPTDEGDDVGGEDVDVDDDGGGVQCEVEAIEGECILDGALHYLVRWSIGTDRDREWVRADSIRGEGDLLQRYEQQRRSAQAALVAPALPGRPARKGPAAAAVQVVTAGDPLDARLKFRRVL